nr:hypothetical protein [uncultured Oscillibacter sp.]
MIYSTGGKARPMPVKYQKKGGGNGASAGPQRLILVSIAHFTRFVYINFSHFPSSGGNLSVVFSGKPWYTPVVRRKQDL